MRQPLKQGDSVDCRFALESMEHWLGNYVVFTFFILVPIVLLFMKLFRVRRKADAEGEIHFPFMYMVSGISGTITGAGLIVFAVVAGVAGLPGALVAMAILVSLLLLPLSPYVAAQYFKARHFVNDEGVRYGQIFGPGGFVKWEEVKNIKVSVCTFSFEIEKHDGKVIRISTHSTKTSLKYFAKLALERLDADTMSNETRRLIRSSTWGVLP